MGQIQINILGKSFKLLSDEDSQFLNKLLDYYEKIVDKVSKADSVQDNLQASIIAGLLLCEELFKEKENKLKQLPKDELEKRTFALIDKIDKVL